MYCLSIAAQQKDEDGRDPVEPVALTPNPESRKAATVIVMVKVFSV